MRRLTLLRHAKSSWNDPVARDFDRPLNSRGKKAAHRIGHWMREKGLVFDVVLASPAVRVFETLDHLGHGLGLALEPTFNERIYLGSAATLIELIQESETAGAHILLVGHNPGLEDMVLELAGDDMSGPMLASVAEKLPTGAVVELEFDCDDWRDIGPGSGIIVRFTRPRDLDPELGPDGS